MVSNDPQPVRRLRLPCRYANDERGTEKERKIATERKAGSLERAVVF